MGVIRPGFKTMAIDIAPTESSDPSMADLRAMISGNSAQPEDRPEPAEPKTAVEPELEAKETAESDSDPANEVVAEVEEKDEALPPNVQKRIAKEVEKANAIQRKIDEAVSRRKNLEKQLADANTGSEPEPTTAAKDSKPVKPVFGSKEGETWAQYQQSLEKYENDRDDWVKSETRKAVEEELTSREQKSKAAGEWDAAVKAQGADFPKLVEKTIVALHEGVGEEGSAFIQRALRDLDSWDSVASHLGKNPKALEALMAKYKERPVAAIAMLGKIEAGLASPPAAERKALPNPPARVGGAASASSVGFDLEGTPMGSSLSAYLRKVKGIK